MKELSERELYQAIEYAKSIDEDTGRKIIEQFQLEQTALAQTIFGIFPSVIAEQDQDMSHLFMDLCFDVLCVFQKAFGPLPSQNDIDIDWVEKQAVLMDTELQSLVKSRTMNDKIRTRLQDRFLKQSIDNPPQLGLIKFMNESIDDFASESANRVPAIQVTQTMIFVVICLFNNLYGHANQKKRSSVLF
jgi:hypothetical protein